MTATVIELDMALVESRTLRARHAERTEALDAIGALALLPDDTHATTEMVAAYYDVPVSTIKSLVEDNRDELSINGYRVLRGAELREFARLFQGPANPVGPRTRSLALFNRRAILLVGMLLRDSQRAQQVRRYALDVEASTAPERRALVATVGPVPFKEQAEVLSILWPMLPEPWATTKAKLLAARVMGELPEIDPAELPLYASVFLEEKGLKRRVIDRFESKFGLRCSNRYFKEYGVRPKKVDGPATSAHIKKINVYKQADRWLLEEVYLGMAAEIITFEQGAAA